MKVQKSNFWYVKKSRLILFKKFVKQFWKLIKEMVTCIIEDKI